MLTGKNYIGEIRPLMKVEMNILLDDIHFFMADVQKENTDVRKIQSEMLYWAQMAKAFVDFPLGLVSEDFKHHTAELLCLLYAVQLFSTNGEQLERNLLACKKNFLIQIRENYPRLYEHISEAQSITDGLSQFQTMAFIKEIL